MKGFEICSTPTVDGPDEINGILIGRSVGVAEFELLRGLVERLPDFIGSGALSRKWKCSVYGTPEWIGNHLALGGAIRPVGTRLEFTSPKPAKKSRA